METVVVETEIQATTRSGRHELKLVTCAEVIIGASQSEPHTSVTSLRSACVCLLACPVDLAITVNFKSANFTCTCTIIFKFNELDELSSYLLDERWRQQRRRPLVDIG